MTVRRAVNAYVSDNLEAVEDAFKGGEMPVDFMARNVLEYMGLPETEENMRRAENLFYEALSRIEDGDRPLWGSWNSMTVTDLEEYIDFIHDKLHTVDSPVYQEVLCTQWQVAEEKWIFKGGNVVHDSPLPVGDNTDSDEEGDDL